jgi:hypothetical protein
MYLLLEADVLNPRAWILISRSNKRGFARSLSTEPKELGINGGRQIDSDEANTKSPKTDSAEDRIVDLTFFSGRGGRRGANGP